MNKEKKVMIITGSRKGIGRYLSEYYLKKGFIVIGCSRKETNLTDNRYSHYYLDVSDEKKVKLLFNDIKKKHGRLDVLINNAGIASMNHTLLTPMATVKKIFETNLLGCFLFSREAAKQMMKNKEGRIVNFTTVAVPMKLEGEAVYAASKSAINTLTQILAAEFVKFGITVNAIGPTPTNTDLIRSVPKHKIEQLLLRLPLKKLGTYEDIVNISDFFIKPESSNVTGQIIYLGGV